ncbi:F-actin-capping subunit alpha protein [Rutstroemia sp. NJR-2017a WRK4]|nr:F-actin-capping subunit alpha protein [Rutstroemia sp. NJR-2017a WRK4]
MADTTMSKARPVSLSTTLHRYLNMEAGLRWHNRFNKRATESKCGAKSCFGRQPGRSCVGTPQKNKSILKSLGPHVAEHFPNASYGAYPIENDSKIAIIVVANKYSPNNFWNGRWRSLYIYEPSSSSLTGSIKVDVHYYEDGNVRLLTNKPLSLSVSSSSASGIVREIATAEKRYQEEINKGFNNLSEGAFKGLRRQLPITRQKIEWDKIAGYRLGQDIGGGSSKK